MERTNERTMAEAVRDILLDAADRVDELLNEPTNEPSNEGTIMDYFQKKKQTVEQTHTRDTFLIENELLAHLNRIAERKPKGFKKELVNMLLREAVEKIEKMEGITK